MAVPRGRRGRLAARSDAAVRTRLTKALFGLALRQTAGLVGSLPELAGLGWPAPGCEPRCAGARSMALAIPGRLAPLATPATRRVA